MNKSLVLIFILSFSASVAKADEVLLRVRPHVVVTPKAPVTLDQLVYTEGLSSAAKEKILAMTLTKAPAYGERQELAQASLMEVLRPIVQQERISSNKRVHLVMPRNVVIDTLKRDITKDAVSAELMQVWAPLCSECKLEIDGLSLPAIQGVRDWTLKPKAELPRGSFSIPVDIVRLDQSPVTAWVTGRLVSKRKVPVLTRVLTNSERVQPDDYKWEYRDTSFAIDGVPRAEDIDGRRLKVGKMAGEILWSSHLEKEKAIRRGESVQVKSGEGTWVVSMTVVAQQDAMIGDVINFKNPKTNSTVIGQVTGFGEVELR